MSDAGFFYALFVLKLLSRMEIGAFPTQMYLSLQNGLV